MKLKDIVPYCLDFAQKPGGNFYDIKYQWVIKGCTYSIQSFQTYSPANILDHDYYDHQPYLKFNHEQNSDSFITLKRCAGIKDDPKNNLLTLNLNNEITIFDKFIMVHKTDKNTTDSEHDLFFKTNYFIANGHSFSAEIYNIGLYYDGDYDGGGMKNNLRTVFKDLIDPPVSSKPAELTLDEKVDAIIYELMKDSKTMAIKKLKRMLNERL